LAERARIVLLASEGVKHAEIVARIGVTRPTVNLWRSRYAEAGLAGLADLVRPRQPNILAKIHRKMQVCGVHPV
jgi:transposase